MSAAPSVVQAVLGGSVAGVREAIGAGGDVNAVETAKASKFKTRQTTALFEAVAAGSEELTRVVLDCEATDVNRRAAAFKHSPLAYACDAGATGLVDILLADARIDVNAGSDGLGAPFALAVTKGHVAVVKQLLARDDIDVNALSRGGLPPLAEAVRGEHDAIIVLLLADDRVDTNAQSTGADPASALVLAVKSDQRDVVQVMMDSGRVDFEMEEGRAGLRGIAKEAGLDRMFALLDQFFLKRSDMGDLGEAEQIEKLRYEFKSLDVEQRGYINKEQLGKLAASVGTCLEQAELDEAAVAMDVSRDGKICFDELVAFWTGP